MDLSGGAEEVDLTADERHWIAVSVENSLASARLLADSDDALDQVDAGLLIEKYVGLQKKFPPPTISLR